MVIAPRLGPRGSLLRSTALLLLLLLAVSSSCRKPDPRLAEADAALKSGELERALDLASEVQRETPGSAPALDRKGLALQGLGRQGAEEAFREAIPLEP